MQAVKKYYHQLTKRYRLNQYIVSVHRFLMMMHLLHQLLLYRHSSQIPNMEPLKLSCLQNRLQVDRGRLNLIF